LLIKEPKIFFILAFLLKAQRTLWENTFPRYIIHNIQLKAKKRSRIEMKNADKKQLLDRIAYLEEALGNYGEQIRSLNEAVSGLQVGANVTMTESHLAQINSTFEGYGSQIRSLNETISALQIEAQNSSTESPVAVELLLKNRRLFQPKDRNDLSTSMPAMKNAKTFEQQLEEIESVGYGAYTEWFKLLEPNLVSYTDNPEAGISVEENAGARLFRDFVAPYALGTVLDVGCGIASMPAYLADFEKELVAGSDPLSPELKRDFNFYHGLAEKLPWQDNSFDNVVIGTSMDHFLDPYKALDEAKRVMKPNGFLLLWMGFIPGGEQYDPFTFDSKPVDEFHLFHFDKEWFDPMIEKNFLVKECIPINEVSSFYACAPLK